MVERSASVHSTNTAQTVCVKSGRQEGDGVSVILRLIHCSDAIS